MTSISPVAEQDRSWVWTILVVLVGLGAVLRLHGIAGESIWLDEAATWIQTRGDIISTVILTGKDTYPPLFNLFVLPSVKLFGDVEWALRLPAALLGIISIPAVFWLGKLAGGTRVGLIAATIHTLSPFAVYYSQEARMYSLLMLTSTLFCATTLLWLQRASVGRGLLMVLAAFALVHSHPYGTFAWLCVGGAGLLALILRQGWRRAPAYLGWQFLIFVLFVPWIIVMMRVATDVVRRGFWIDQPDLARVFTYTLELTGGPLGLALFAAGWLLALPWAGKILRPLDASAEAPTVKQDAVILLIALAVGPMLIGYVLSQITTPILVPRYVICSLPAMTILAAIGLARLAPKGAELAAPLALVGLLLVPPNAMARQPRHSEDWKSLVTYLHTNMRDGDCVLVNTDHGQRVLDYYQFARPACYFRSVDDAVGKLGNARLIAADDGADLSPIKQAFPGIWTAEQNFGRGLALAIREPAR